MTNNPSLTIRQLHARHKQENPDSMISEKMIRASVKRGDLPAVFCGNKALISYQTFEQWRTGNLNRATPSEGLRVIRNA